MTTKKPNRQRQRALKAYERLRAREKGGFGTIEPWGELIEGRWHVVDYFSHEDARVVTFECVKERDAAEQVLSDRERQVLELVVVGQSHEQITKRLNIAKSTVCTHIRNACTKIGLDTWRESLTVLGPLKPKRGRSTPVSFGSYAVGRKKYAVVGLPLPTRKPPSALTPAEREILSEILEGKPNGRIADEREVSIHTVTNQVAAIYRKNNVNSRRELLKRYGRR